MEIRGLINRESVRAVIRHRPRDVHKGDCGRILIAAGSREMAGAAVFAAGAAVKSGSGLVSVCTTKNIFPVLQTAVPECICRRFRVVRKGLARYDAVAAGPGMGNCRKTKKILAALLKQCEGTLVIDADGLNVIAGSRKLQELVRTTGASVVITPHKGEAARLLGDADISEMTRLEIVQALQKKYRCITVLKGAGTLVAVSEEEACLNTSGNPGMATAGAGDVLTGIIVSLAGQGLPAAEAARAGVFLHGRAGDLAAARIGEYGLCASDLTAYLPFALKEMTETD